MVIDWHKRGTAEGFSSVNFVLPILAFILIDFKQIIFIFRMSCWCKHGFLTNDNLNIFINVINLVFFTGYILAFAYYQPKRVYFIVYNFYVKNFFAFIK